MVKLKNVVKLQAAIRGHLVRSHAVGTLRCVQAIIKLQALVRARRARLLSEGSCAEGVLHGGHGKNKHSSQLLVMLCLVVGRRVQMFVLWLCRHLITCALAKFAICGIEN